MWGIYIVATCFLVIFVFMHILLYSYTPDGSTVFPSLFTCTALSSSIVQYSFFFRLSLHSCTHCAPASLMVMQFSADCKLFFSSSLESVSLVKCDASLQWMEKIKPSWPNLSHLSLSDTVKTTDYDLKYIGSCKDWKLSLKLVL